jgi:hypothetical protein
MAKKTLAELVIDGMADVFAIATTGFKEFYKKTGEKKSGDRSKSAASGDSSKSVASGECSKSAASGYYSQSAASGNYSQSVASGECSKSAASGYSSRSAASGNYSQSAASGDRSKSVASGYRSKSVASGYRSQSSCSNENSAASALGYRAAVSGDMGNLLMASEYVVENEKYKPVGGKADLVDGKKLKPNCWYIVEGGEWVEVDISDGVFTRVISTKGNVKKVKSDNGNVLYVVRDENGTTSHGKTIKEARADLIYKYIAKFDGDLPKKATGAEWIGIYRAVTGACAQGVKMFVKAAGHDLSKTYTVAQIVKMTQGQYGAEKFAEKAKG